MCTREINGSVVISIDLIDHILQLGLGRVLAKRSHDRAEFFSCDLSCIHHIRLVVPQDRLLALLAVPPVSRRETFDSPATNQPSTGMI
jgi:hypothetical protein